MRLFGWTLWRKETLYRRSGFRVVEESSSRIVLGTRNYGLLAGGSAFIAMGLGMSWVGVEQAWGKPGTLAAILVFAAIFWLFGLVIIWVSRTQRDTIVVDRDAGKVRSQRALKRRRAGGSDMFKIEERSLDDLRSVGIRYGTGSGWLRFRFRSGDDIDIDYATDVEHLKSLGERLAAVARVELEEM